MATVYPLIRPATGMVAEPVAFFRNPEEEDSIETLSLIAKQFGEAAGADGTALVLHGADDGDPSVLALDGACVRSGAPPVRPGDMPAAAADGGQWLLRRFPVSRDGRTFVLLGALFERARSGARRVADAEALFHPMIAGFARLWGRDRASRHSVRGYAAALNHSDVGVVMLDGEANILFANAAAEALIDKGQGLRRRRSSLSAANLGEAVKLQIAIDHVIAADPGEVPLKRVPVVALTRGANDRPLLVSVMSPNEAPRGARDVAAILYLCDPELDLTPLMAAACRYYRLSPVETRLACRLATGETLADAATALRIKEQTARGYLKQIFIKTDTRRQGELIRIMLTSVSRTPRDHEIDIV